MKTKFLLAFCCFAFLSLSCAFSASADDEFHHVNSIWGISKNKIFSLCMDNDGFVYGASKMGIIRVAEGDYRDIDFDVPDNVSELSLFMGGNTMYAYTDNGYVYRRNNISEKFEHIMSLADSISYKYFNVTGAVGVNDDTIYLATSNGLVEIAGDKMRIVSPEERVRVVEILDAHNLLCVGNRRIYKLSLEDFSMKNFIQFPVNREFNSVFIDSENNSIYLGSYTTGLSKLSLDADTASISPVMSVPALPVRSIEQVSDSSFMVGTDGAGIYEIARVSDKQIKHYFYDPDVSWSINGNGVYDIIFDGDSRVWVSTYTGGISYIDISENSPLRWIAHQSNNIQSLPDFNVNCIFEDSHGDIWFGTDQGASRWSPSDNNWVHTLGLNDAGKSVLTINEDVDGNRLSSAEVLFDDVNFIDYMLVNFYGGNTDWDHHNWVAVHRHGDSEGFKWLTWDSELVLQAYRDNVMGVNNANCPTYIFHTLMDKCPAFKLKFVDRAFLALGEQFGFLQPDSVQSVWEDLTSEISAAMHAESARWGDYRRDVHPYVARGELYTKSTHFDPQCDFMREKYFPNRSSVVLQQLKSAGLWSDVEEAPVLYIDNVAVSSPSAEFDPSCQKLALKGASSIYFTTDGSDPVYFSASGNPTVSPSAVRASGMINVSADCVIKARIRGGNRVWGPLLERSLSVSNDTGVNSVTIDDVKVDPTIYNMLGQPVKNPSPGVYIQNGKVLIIR